MKYRNMMTVKKWLELPEKEAIQYWSDREKSGAYRLGQGGKLFKYRQKNEGLQAM